jgi:thiol:disulfide interchange protein DsbC
MVKKCASMMFVLVLTLSSIAFADGTIVSAAVSNDSEISAVHAKVNQSFPSIIVNDIRRTDVKGLYELEAGDGILYYYPEKELIFAGELYNKEGKSLTAERVEAIVERKLKELPLDKAIKTGSGPNTVIEFIDPDCPYCRKAYEWFKTKTGITRYTFLTPIPQLHPKATEKSEYVLSQKTPESRVAALHDVMEGKLDNKTLEGINEDGKKAVELHKSLGRKVGLNGTPLFFVNGKMISGADYPGIEQNLQR